MGNYTAWANKWRLRASNEARAKKHTLPQLVEWVKSFHKDHGRIPTVTDIKERSKKGLAPGLSSFYKKGGLNWVIENAGLEVQNRYMQSSPEEVVVNFRSFVKKFREINNGRWPGQKEYVEAAIRGECPSVGALSRHTHRSYKELLEWLGKPPRRM